MMMAVAGAHGLPGVIARRRDAAGDRRRGRGRSRPSRPFAHGAISLEEAADMAAAPARRRAAAASSSARPRLAGGCRGARLSVVHSAPRSGQPVWLDMARRSARGVPPRACKKTVRDVVTDAAIRTMVVHAPSAARPTCSAHSRHRACRRPGPSDHRPVVRRELPRAAPGRRAAERPAPDRARVPPAACRRMLHLRDLGLLDLSVLTAGRAARRHAGVVEASPRRQRVRHRCASATASIRRRDHAAGPGPVQGLPAPCPTSAATSRRKARS